MNHTKTQSSTSVINFNTTKTTGDVGNIASLMAEGVILLEGTIHMSELTLVDLPAEAGQNAQWPLQGTPVRLVSPFDPAASDEWDALE